MVSLQFFLNLPVLASMLRDERRDLLTLAGEAPVLDIGCGDGDLSFFFESLGCRVVAIDNFNPNFNQTAGFKALHSAMHSSVEFQMSDLDAGLDLQGRTFRLALCLGVLYHSRNPYAFLQALARQTRYCLLSTRIAQVTPRGTPIADEPVAYVLDAFEVNNDASNYWIFSEAGCVGFLIELVGSCAIMRPPAFIKGLFQPARIGISELSACFAADCPSPGLRWTWRADGTPWKTEAGDGLSVSSPYMRGGQEPPHNRRFGSDSACLRRYCGQRDRFRYMRWMGTHSCPPVRSTPRANTHTSSRFPRAYAWIVT